MDVFGPRWEGYTDKIAREWAACVKDQDFVLIAGDLSWAMRPEEARPDFEWIGNLPGTKIFIEGNHDYWLTSPKKARSILPDNCRLIQNDSVTIGNIAIAGARLWDIPGLDFSSAVDYRKNEHAKVPNAQTRAPDNVKIYKRELVRLETSLQSMSPEADIRIAMTHYPPIGLDFQETEASRLLEKYRINICVFGHLHNIKPGLRLFGQHNGIDYRLTACDYLEDFRPVRIL